MGYKDNSFPILQGRVNLESGASIGGSILCIEDGDILIVWDDTPANNVSVSLLAGNSYDLRNVKSATITSGKFHSA